MTNILGRREDTRQGRACKVIFIIHCVPFRCSQSQHQLYRQVVFVISHRHYTLKIHGLIQINYYPILSSSFSFPLPVPFLHSLVLTLHFSHEKPFLSLLMPHQFLLMWRAILQPSQWVGLSLNTSINTYSYECTHTTIRASPLRDESDGS